MEKVLGILGFVCGLGLIALAFYHLMIPEDTGWLGLVYIVLPGIGGSLLIGTGIVMFRKR